MSSSLPLFIILLHTCLWLGNSQTVLTSPLNVNPLLPRSGVLSTAQTWWAAYVADGGISLIGFLLSAIFVSMIASKKIEEGKLRKTLLIMLSLGMGFTMGAAVILMLPKAFGNDVFRYVLGEDVEVNTSVVFNTGLTSFFILLGFNFFFILDMIARHFVAKTHLNTSRAPAEMYRVENAENRTGATGTNYEGVRAERISTDLSNQGELNRAQPASKGSTKQTGLILLRMFMYNWFSGMAVGTVFATYSSYNIASLCIALLFAEIFLEMVDTTLLYYSGLTKGRAIIFNLLMNIVAWGGVAAGRALGSPSLKAIAYLFAAEVGVFLYLVAVHLMPAIMKGKKYDTKVGYIVAFLASTALVFAIRAIET
jgi:zinc transporter ZupT